MSIAVVFHQGPAWELVAKIRPTRLGHHLRIESLSPTSRTPAWQTRFETVLTTAELRALHAALSQALGAPTWDANAANGGGIPVDSSRSPGEPLAA